MAATAPSREMYRRAERGVSLLELVIVTGIIGILASILLPAYMESLHASQSRALAAEGRSLLTALLQYHHDQGRYPSDLDVATFEPLTSQSYYRGNVAERLLAGSIDVYESPDDDGTDQEFYIEMTLRADRRYRLLVADSDDAPLSGGEPIQGIALYRDSRPLPL